MSAGPPAAVSPYAPPPLAPLPARSPLRWIVNVVLGCLASAAAGIALGVLLALTRRHLGLDWLDGIRALVPAVGVGWTLVFAVLMVWPNVLLHEAGHALGGLARGMQPLAFGVGPWRWERSADRWRMRRGGRVRGISGFAILLPRGERGQSRFDQFVYLIGGPAANLATFALALAVLPLAADSPRLGAFLVGTAVGAALFGFVNLVPFVTKGWRSDGRNLLDLFRRSADAERSRRVRETLALTMAGVRPRDWPSASLPSLPGDDEGAPSLSGLSAVSQVLSHAVDGGDATLARTCAGRLVAGYAHVPEAMRPHLALGMAAFAAGIEHDRDLLAAWRPLCEGGLFDLTAARAWLDAELAVLSGDVDAARAAITTARALRVRTSDELSGRLLDERLDALDARLDADVRASTVKDA